MMLTTIYVVLIIVECMSTKCNGCNMEIKDFFVLKEWINKEKLDWSGLSLNPCAIRLLEQNQEKIDWRNLNQNPNAINLLIKNPKRIDLQYFDQNPNEYAIRRLLGKPLKKYNDRDWCRFLLTTKDVSFLEKYPEEINWFFLSSNPNAIDLLERNLDKVVWSELSSNKNAIHLLEKNPEKIDWRRLSLNKNAIALLEKNLEKIDWYNLSFNKNAIALLEKNQEKIHWRNLAQNENAMKLFERNPEKINWYLFSMNPFIFDRMISYKFLKERINIISSELMMICMHPSRLERFLEMSGEIDDFQQFRNEVKRTVYKT